MIPFVIFRLFMTSKESQVLFLGNVSSFEKEIKPKLIGVSDNFLGVLIVLNVQIILNVQMIRKVQIGVKEKICTTGMNRTKITICFESTNSDEERRFMYKNNQGHLTVFCIVFV